MAKDNRLQAFLTSPLDVFHAVEHRHEIWREDPFDVETIHPEAREAFRSMLSLATTPPGQERGRILLLRGNAGAGKTHLLRAFRNEVHSTRAGLVGYMPMTSQSANYARYILSNLIDSLDQPYDEITDTRSGLVRLAGILASRAFQPQLASLLRDEPDLGAEEIADIVTTGAEKLLSDKRYAYATLDLLRALLFLHRPDPRIKTRVLMYLRCEDLSEADQKVLGGLKPRTAEEHPAQMISRLGRLIWAIGNMALVICLDQLEGLWNDDTSRSAKRAIQTVCDLADDVPSSVFVICCLDDIYVALRSKLIQSYIERIEHDPKPCILKESLTPKQAEDVIAARLRHLYLSSEATFLEEERLFPFTEGFVAELANRATRALLRRCNEYREVCKAEGRLVDPKVLRGEGTVETPVTEQIQQAIGAWEQRWSDELAASKVAPPDADDEASILALLSWAVDTAGEELESGWRFAARKQGSVVSVETRRDGRVHAKTWVAICNRTPRFGWLEKQIQGYAEEARAHADHPRLVLVRSSEFSKADSVNKAIKEVIKQGGRTIVVPHGDWRVMLTFQMFQRAHKNEPYFDAWAMAENHLSQLPSLRAMLDLDRLEREVPPAPTLTVKAPKTPAASASSPAKSGAAPAPTAAGAVSNIGKSGTVRATTVSIADAMIVGFTKGLSPQPITLTAAEMTRHAAFLGGSGSGKTTLALNVVEQLLLRGIPVILVDRKGDLAGYARKTAWSGAILDEELDARRVALRDKVDVALFTPGHAHGRPLSIALAPDGLADMGEVDREEASACAASALADMLGYKTSSKDKTLRAILLQAFQVLASLTTDSRIDLQAVIDLVNEEDPALVSAVGKLDTKLFRQIVQDAETLKITTTQLFSSSGEPLDVDLLLGTGAHARPGRTRLSIISTKFLRDESQVLFWVAQLLLAISRWSAKNPKDRLQAVVMFDEADMYLPALRQPATKAPMENLLKRSRSAGLGVMLATQSPGDLDYRCRDNVRTWFLGRIKEQTALQKVKPMVEVAPGDILSKLPSQETGEFCVVGEKKVSPFRARRSVLETEQIADEELILLARETLAGFG
ncbi:helicase HerA-like domain-containing protein [Sorangium sp. So ce296]|uniref:helicase HerA-like domain-containing protein n=1 Tax=Sorangium sp. So ce296 TaxID=3133296 RepID=UPI003F638D50